MAVGRSLVLGRALARRPHGRYTINYDVRALLKWKNSRVELVQSGSKPQTTG